MSERRKPKVQIGRRSTDVPVKILEAFKEELKVHMTDTIEEKVNTKLQNIEAKMTQQALDIQPLLDLSRNVKWGGRLIIGVVGVLSAIGGLYLIAMKIFNKSSI